MKRRKYLESWPGGADNVSAVCAIRLLLLRSRPDMWPAHLLAYLVAAAARAINENRASIHTVESEKSMHLLSVALAIKKLVA